MWTYTVAFLSGVPVDRAPFIMVRSRKRGGWEMPGGRLKSGEDPFEGAKREFLEETGRKLQCTPDKRTGWHDGYVYFGRFRDEVISEPITGEVLEVKIMSEVPDDLAFPREEYDTLIAMGKKILKDRSKGR